MTKVTITTAEYAALKALRISDPIGFNPRVYMSLEARFGDMQPKGGVLNLKSIKRSKGKLFIDTYGRGCVHNVKTPTEFGQRKRSNWNRPMPFPSEISTIADALYSIPLRKPIPVVLGSQSDPFMWMDHKYGVTKATLNLFNNYRWKISTLAIHTRSDLIANDDYVDILKDLSHIAVVYIHMPRGSEETARYIEPGAPSKKRRFQAARKLREHGITVRIVREGTVAGNKALIWKK